MPAPPFETCRADGFTLLELLTVLAIAAILLALAAPALSQQRATSAVQVAASQILAALHLARRTALAQGQSVTACPSANGVDCGFGGREWLLFANAPGGSEARREPGEEVLRRWALPPHVVVGGTRGYAAFQPRPGAAATVTFEFCHEAWPQFRRRVVVSQTGRPRLDRPQIAALAGVSSCTAEAP
jgi:type IV fimbrial biogenesis protein FimT